MDYHLIIHLMCMVSRLNLLVILQRTSVDDLDCFLIIDVPRKSARSARWRQCSDGQTCIPPLRRRSRRFNLQDCLRLSEMIKERDGRGVPVVFDTHHEECYRMSHPEETLPTVESLLPRVLETWAVTGRVPMSPTTRRQSQGWEHTVTSLKTSQTFSSSTPECFQRS